MNATDKRPTSLTGRKTSSGINYVEFERRIVKVFERDVPGYKGLMMLSENELESVFKRFSGNHLTFNDAVSELLDSFRVACGQH